MVDASLLFEFSVSGVDVALENGTHALRFEMRRLTSAGRRRHEKSIIFLPRRYIDPLAQARFSGRVLVSAIEIFWCEL